MGKDCTIAEELLMELSEEIKENILNEEQDGISNTVIDRKDVRLSIDNETLTNLKKEIYKNIEYSKNSEGKRILICKVCSKKFQRMDKASSHIETHLYRFKFACQFCDKIANTRIGLKGHIIDKHTKNTTEADAKKISIEKHDDNSEATPMVFIDRKDVKINIDQQTLKKLNIEIKRNLERCEKSDGQKISKCKFCGKTFLRRDKASVHVESHLEEFNFNCNYCEKITKTRKGLKSHIIFNHVKN